MLHLNIYLDIMAYGKVEVYSLMSIYISVTQGCLVFVCVCVNCCSLSMSKDVPELGF